MRKNSLRSQKRYSYLNLRIEPKIPYGEIYNGNLKNKIEIFRSIEINLERRHKIKEDKIPCDLRDPLNFDQFGFG